VQDDHARQSEARIGRPRRLPGRWLSWFAGSPATTGGDRPALALEHRADD
jgi:hypothetical protein